MTFRWRGVLVAASIGVVGGCTAPAAPTPTPSSSILAVLDQAQENPDAAALADFAAKRNAVMVACMKEQGFAYVPYVPAPEPRVALGLTEERFATQYGFGASTLIDFRVPGTQQEDPNIVAALNMGPTEQAAILARLNECRKRVEREIGPAPGAGPGTVSRADGDQMRALHQAVLADPRLVHALDDRAKCLNGKGYSSTDEVTVPDPLLEGFRTAYQNAVRELERQGRDSSQLRIEDVLTPDQMVQLRKIQQQEIAKAVAVVPCQKAYDDLYRAVYREYLDKALAGEK